MMFTTLLVVASRVAFATQACASGIQGSMLLQTTHSSSLGAALELQEDLGTDVGEHSDKFSSMLQYITEEGALAGNRSNYTMSQAVRLALQTFREYLRDMHNTTIRLHNSDQADINEAVDNAEHCHTSGSLTLPSSVVTERNAHSTCRQDQVSMHDAKKERCDVYDGKLLRHPFVEDPVCYTNLQNSGAINSEVRATFNACLEWLHNWTHLLFENYEECRDTTGNLTQQQARCDEKQTLFESASCQVHGGFCDCESRATTHYDLRVAAVAKSELIRKSDVRAAAHIECMVRVLLANASDVTQNITAMLNTCKNRTENITHLNVDYGTLPTASTECETEVGPCSTAWTNKEYVGKNWSGAKAQIINCTECATPAPPTPAPLQPQACTPVLVTSEKPVVACAKASSRPATAKECTEFTADQHDQFGANLHFSHSQDEGDRVSGCRLQNGGDLWYNRRENSEQECSENFPCICCIVDWTLVARQTVPTMFVAGEWSKNPDDPSNDNYAILDQLENFRDQDGKLEFKLVWPDTQDQIWRQTSNPVTKTSGGVDGYEAISAPQTARSWGGLEYNGKQTLLDGDIGGNWAHDVSIGANWFYAIGSYAEWQSGIPGPGTPVQRVELYAKTKVEAEMDVWADPPSCPSGFAMKEGHVTNFGSCEGTTQTGYCILPKAEAADFCRSHVECIAMAQTTSDWWNTHHPGMVQLGKLPLRVGGDQTGWRVCQADN